MDRKSLINTTIENYRKTSLANPNQRACSYRNKNKQFIKSPVAFSEKNPHNGSNNVVICVGGKNET